MYYDPSGYSQTKGHTPPKEENIETNVWKDIDEYRTNTNGLNPLGDSVPKKGDNNGTVALIETNGEKIFGVNSSLLTDAEKDLGRKYFENMQDAGYYKNVKRYGQGSSQVFTHAEAYALMQAHSKYGSKLGDSVTIYVDRATCGICQNNLPILKQYMGIKNLKIVNKNGNIFNY